MGSYTRGEYKKKDCTCVICGAGFKAKSSSKYCSNKCRVAGHRKNKISK